MDGWMDGWMDGRTDGRTDHLSPREVSKHCYVTHLTIKTQRLSIYMYMFLIGLLSYLLPVK